MPQFGGDPFLYLRGRALGRKTGVVAPFSPADLGAKLILWWDAEDASSLALSGSSVTGWTDKSAAFAASQATGASQPTLSATAVNNRPGVVFDGVDDFLTNAGTPSKVAAGNPREWWFLGTQTRDAAEASGQRVFLHGAAVTSAVQLLRGASNRVTSSVGNGVGAGSASVLNGFSGVVVTRQQIASDQIAVTLNGGTPATFSMTPSLTNSSMFIGSRDAVSQYHQGAINTLIETEPLNETESAQMYAYLAARAGV